VQGPSIGGAAAGGSGDFAYLSWWDEYTQERSPLSPATEIGTGQRIWQNLPLRPPDDVHISEGTMNFENDPGDGEFFWTDDPRTRTFYLRPGDLVTVATPSIYWDFVDTVLSERIFTTLQGGGLFGGGGSGSGDKAGLTMAAQPFTRATHLELWVSIAGGLPRKVMQVEIGSETVTENTSAQSLGESYIDAFRRFPFCSINAIYHDRQLMAGDPDAPDTLYISQLFFPERWGGLTFRTRNGERIVSIIGTRDYALVMTDRSSYILQGYTDNDLTFTVADPNIGAITHVGNTVVHGMPFVWTDAGPYLFNGSWHPMSPENKYFLRECLFQESNALVTYKTPDLFRDMSWISYFRQPDEQFRFWQGSRDPNWNCWITGGTVVMDYTPVAPQAGGSFSVGRMSLDLGEAQAVDSNSWVFQPVHPEVTSWMRDEYEEKGALWMAYRPVANGLASDFLYLARMDDAPVEYNTDFHLDYFYTEPNGSGGLQYNGLFVPFIPFDFVVEFPFHGHQDMDSGAYEREGKVYRQAWLHAMQEGSDTRFWSNAPLEQLACNVWTLEEKQSSSLYLYPGEESSVQVLSSPAYKGIGTSGVQQIDFTESLGSRGQIPEGTVYGPLEGWTIDNGEQGSKMAGIHGTPPLTGVSGRGLNAIFYSKWTGAKIRVLGFGGVYGAGPHNLYGVDPWS
jgi:hypothetical protein